jgi:hypothetical protein
MASPVRVHLAAASLLDRAATRQKIYHQDYQSYHEQQVNQTASMERKKPQCP